jgi:Subtilisin inhibitor-like
MDMTPLPDVALATQAAPATRNAPASRLALAGPLVACTCVLLAACGSAAAPATGGASSTAARPGPAKVSLDVTFAAAPGSPAAHYTLFCEPAGGTTPDPAAACTKLLTGLNIFAPRPLHVMCPMIVQSDARATVVGTYLGKRVHVTIVNGGCDLPQWSKLTSIFG